MNSSAADIPPSDPDGELAALRSRLDALHRSELERWADSVRAAEDWQDEIKAMRETVSWRVTAPLRVVRTRRLNG